MRERTFAETLDADDEELAMEEEDFEPFSRAQLNRNAQLLRFVLLATTAGSTPWLVSLSFDPPAALPPLPLSIPAAAFVIPWPRQLLHSFADFPVVGGGVSTPVVGIGPFLRQFSPQTGSGESGNDK